MSLNVSHGSDMASSDVEDDNLNENLMEFERNILIDEEINIRKSQSVCSDFEISESKPNRRPSNSNIRQDDQTFNEAIPSSADDESSSQGEMTIHLPGAPVTADLQMAESEQIEEEDNWSESEMFHGFNSDEIDEQVNIAENNRSKLRLGSYDSSDDLISPINNEKLMLELEEDRIFEAIKFKVLSEREVEERFKHKQVSSQSDTTVISSSKSPLKMVFKKTSSSMTVSPSVTPTPPVSSNFKPNNRNESFAEVLATQTDTSPTNSQQFKGSSSVRKTSISSNIGDIKSVAKKALPEPMRRESREWKPSAQFFKPLLAGWKREVIFENRDPDTRELLGKPEQIVYHAPPNPGCKARSFKSLAELGSFLSSASSALTLHNFSFRKELMNAPRNQEIAHAIDEEAVIFPKHQSSTVSQPPPPKIGSNKESLSKPNLLSNPTISDQPGVKPFSHAPKSWNSNQQYVSPNTSNPLLSGRGSGTGKLKPKVFSKTMGQERNVIGGHSPLINERELKKTTGSPSNIEESNYTTYEEEDKLILDEGSNDANHINLSQNEDISHDINAGMVGIESSPHDTASIYNHSSQSNQLTPSVSLTPISQRTSGTSTPPIARHNMPATAMMNTSISPKPLAKKPSKQSKFSKSASEIKTSRPVLRPNDMTSGVTCSIHCELASGIPTLCCHKCQSWFHPVCVGLMEGPDYSGFDFYCADCPPPPGKENVQMPPPLTRKKPLQNQTDLNNPALTNTVNSKGLSAATITPTNMLESSNDIHSSRYGEPKISITPTNGSKNLTSRWPQNQTKTSQPTHSKSKSLKRPLSSVDVSPVVSNTNYKKAKQKPNNPLMSGTTTLTPVSRSQASANNDENAIAGNKKVTPLRPVEAQTVINIGGIKYLVVPHPPSPDSKTDSSSAKKKMKSTSPDVAEQEKRKSNNVSKLPFLLRPAAGNNSLENGDLNTPPTFEIEETKDGKLILLPISAKDRNNIPGCMMKQNGSQSNSPDNSNSSQGNGATTVSRTSSDFTNNLSIGYFALLSVFQYLNPQERAKSGRVCKLWREISKHQSLWENVSLRNCSVSDWKSFAEYISQVHTTSLDVRKVSHVHKSTNQQNGPLSAIDRQILTWSKFAEAAPFMKDLKRLELPKIRACDLQKIISNMKIGPHVKLSSIIASSIVSSDSKDANNLLNFETISEIPLMEEIKLRASSNQLCLNNLTSGLEKLVSTHLGSLKRLSLLSVGPNISYNHFEIISQLTNLESLELGDCFKSGNASGQGIPLNKLVSLKKLVHLRIEKGEIGREVGTLEMLTNLDRLELIDTELKQGFSDGFIRLRKLKQLLLIPSYKEEVATVNSEIVDSVLSMAELNLFILGLTNEWLESMNSLLQMTGTAGKDVKPTARDSFPILVNGVCEMFSLKKLYKTLTDALPSAQVKILKMPRSATTKQSILGRKL